MPLALPDRCLSIPPITCLRASRWATLTLVWGVWTPRAPVWPPVWPCPNASPCPISKWRSWSNYAPIPRPHCGWSILPSRSSLITSGPWPSKRGLPPEIRHVTLITPCFGHDHVKRLVCGFKRQVFASCAAKAKPIASVAPLRKQFKRAVVKPAAIAQTPAVRDQRPPAGRSRSRVQKIIHSRGLAPRMALDAAPSGSHARTAALPRPDDHRHTHQAIGRGLGHGGVGSISVRIGMIPGQRHAAIPGQNFDRYPGRAALPQQAALRRANAALRAAALSARSLTATPRGQPEKGEKPDNIRHRGHKAPEASAGSTPKRSKQDGITVPADPATTMLTTIAAAIT